jgi:hypothetical protein
LGKTQVSLQEEDIPRIAKMLFILKSNSENLFFPDQANDFTQSPSLQLVSCGIFTHKKLQSPYHLSIILDNVVKIRLGSFIMPAGTDCFNFTAPFEMFNHIRGDLTKCKIEFVFEPLKPKQDMMPKINFTYVNAEVTRTISLDCVVPRKRRRRCKALR